VNEQAQAVTVNFRNFICSIVAALALASCSTSVSSTKMTSASQNGLRYSLPQPFLMVTPASDGSITVEVVYLPDPNNQYSVTTSSFLSSYDLTVATTNGMLKSVGYKQNNAELAAQITQSTGNLVAAQQQAEAKQEQQQASNIAAAQKSVDDAQAQLDKDTAILKTLQARGAATPADYARVEADKAALKDGKDRLNLVKMSGAGNVPQPGFSTGKAYGPLLYRILPNPSSGGVSLVAASQDTFATSAVIAKSSPSAPTGAAGGQAKFSIKDAKEDPPLIHRAGAAPISLTILSPVPLSNLGPLHLDAADPNATSADRFIKSKEIDTSDHQQIHIQLDPGIKNGVYVLSISVTDASGEKAANDVIFKIAP
jgi:hypothetical protein